MSETRSPDWVQIKATVKTCDLEKTENVMSMISNSLQIDDYSDIDEGLLDGIYGDLIDEDLLKKDRTRGTVSVYVTEDRSPAETAEQLRGRLKELGVDADIECVGIKEEDWANSWKKWYKPIKTGKNIVIVPEWEKYDPKPGELTVIMNPGMAFGAGTHETTRLCATLLERYIEQGDEMLDVGCGSGILAICASRLGAKEALACDLDPMAIKVANENIGLNKMDNVHAFVSDLLREVPRKEDGYNIICANIVADVIIRMSDDIGEYMAGNGKLIVSGIIEPRANEVNEVLISKGFKVLSSMTENGWYAACITA